MEDHKGSTVFEDAFIEWRNTILMKKKSHKSRFLLACNNAILESKGSVSPEMILEGIKQIESKNAQKFGARTTRKILGPVVNVLKDYRDVIDTCCQADPFPSAIIWGSLKVIIDGLGRHFELFDKIRSQLHKLQFQLERLKWFDELWGDSDDMQKYLCSTYIQVFRFWSAVDKECDRISVSALMRATTSFSTKKIQAIIDDLSAEVDKVDKLGPVVEARISRGERQNSEEERRAAGLERMENKRERKEASEFRRVVLDEQARAEKERSYLEISHWLESRASNRQNSKRHYDNIDERFGDTCDWLLTASWYKNWINSNAIKESILWLYAQPGSGKSILCSHAMAHVSSLPDEPAVIFQFFHFDEQTTCRQLLYNIAAQLFEHYWQNNKTIPDGLSIKTGQAANDHQNITEMIHTLVANIPKVYIFLDGLDEEDSGARQKEALRILDFILELTAKFPGHIQLWLSSQDRAIFRSRLATYTVVDIQAQIKIAVQKYLSQALPGLCDLPLDPETQNWALKELQKRADGHFLWATLMIKEITISIPSISHLRSFIKNGLPMDLHGYYARILGRYQPGPELEHASKVLSIVAFARRPLSLDEIIEAVWIISDGVEKGDTIFRTFVQKLFAPLIVLDHDKNSGKDLCRLFHSTARHYLFTHPKILETRNSRKDGSLSISQYVIASACFAILRQKKYSALVHNTSTDKDKDEIWVTSKGENIANDQLLTYSAKYWDKHLDDAEETPQLRLDVERFLRSPNFGTTLQLQCLFVQSHFGVYSRGENNSYVWLKRVLPKWFTSRDVLKSRAPGTRLRKDYREFVSEWKWFLHQPTCPRPSCRKMPYTGEIDRCLWGALGSQSFLVGNTQRYESFMLANVDAPKKRLSRNRNRICVDGFALDGTRMAIIHFPSEKSIHSAEPNFQVETWNLTRGASPTLDQREDISIAIDTCHWSLYSSAMDGSRKLVPVKFGDDLGFLRLGSQIFSRNEEGFYKLALGAKSTNDVIPWYFEEFATRGQYIVLTSRRKPSASVIPPDKNDKIIVDTDVPAEDADSEESDLPSTPSVVSKATSVKSSIGKESSRHSTADSGDDNNKSITSSDEDSETHDIESISSSDSLDPDSDDEDWSEGSTDLEKLGFPPPEEEQHSDVSETPSSSDTEPESAESTDSDHPQPRANFIRLDDSDSGDEVNFGDGSDGLAFRRRLKSGTPKGSITVFDSSLCPPKLVFQYSHPLPITLYDSSPVIHPTKPLVVWPLCGGDILFADFMLKSHFIRKSRATSRHTRHVFMKAHFSSDGAYLHMASLEAQTVIPEKKVKSKEKSKTPPPLQLSLFVTTHRLSQSKTTRSPPNLIHRVKINLGSVTSLGVSQIPLSMTWTPTHLFCTGSSLRLRVMKIELFGNLQPLSSTTTTTPSITGNLAVLAGKSSIMTVPQNDILLPDSCRVRETHYYPPTTPNEPATILIGSLNSIAHRQIEEMLIYEEDARHFDKLPDASAPPIGLYVTETDLGGWVSQEERLEDVKGRHGRGGGLERRVEKFDAEDDCDIEIYLS